MESLLQQIQEILTDPTFIYIGTPLVLIIAGLGVPIPEEAVFLTAGYVGSLPEVGANVWVLCVFGVVGIMLGDSVPYWLGRKYGMSLLRHRFFAKLLSPKTLERTEKFFEKHGSKTVFCARFVAGLRMPTFFMAGAMRVTYPKFFAWDLLGALISCPTSIWLSYTYGKIAKEWMAKSHTYVFIFIGLIAAYVVYHVWSHRDTDKEAAPGDAVPTNEGLKKLAEKVEK